MTDFFTEFRGSSDDKECLPFSSGEKLIKLGKNFRGESQVSSSQIYHLLLQLIRLFDLWQNKHLSCVFLKENMSILLCIKFIN